MNNFSLKLIFPEQTILGDGEIISPNPEQLLAKLCLIYNDEIIYSHSCKWQKDTPLEMLPKRYLNSMMNDVVSFLVHKKLSEAA